MKKRKCLGKDEGMGGTSRYEWWGLEIFTTPYGVVLPEVARGLKMAGLHPLRWICTPSTRVLEKSEELRHASHIRFELWWNMLTEKMRMQ
jgi:hypothetical protein